MRLWFSLRDFETLERLKYISSKECGVNKAKNVHRGQQKLLLSEIQFLTSELSSLSQVALCVYVGAASGQTKSHLPFLMDAFPATRWLLCDPLLQDSHTRTLQPYIDQKRVSLFTDFFTEKTARAVNEYMTGNTQNEMSHLLDHLNARECELTLLISDLRSENADEGVILDDMQLQYKMFLAMPCANSAILKFRPPYPDHSTSISHPIFRDNMLTYPMGKILWPIFGGVQTTESRMIIKHYTKLGQYDCSAYEQIMYAFNTLRRPVFDKDAQEKVFTKYSQKFNHSVPAEILFRSLATTNSMRDSPQLD